MLWVPKRTVSIWPQNKCFKLMDKKVFKTCFSEGLVKQVKPGAGMTYMSIYRFLLPKERWPITILACTQPENNVIPTSVRRHRRSYDVVSTSCACWVSLCKTNGPVPVTWGRIAYASSEGSGYPSHTHRLNRVFASCTQ